MAEAPAAAPYTGNLAVSGSRLYGVTAGDYGAIYSMNLDGSNFTILHAFTGIFGDGYAPYGSVTIVGSQLFGTTAGGGAPNDGLLYSMNLDGSNYQVLHTFTGFSLTGPSDGSTPTGGMIANGDDPYGTTSRGGVLDLRRRILRENGCVRFVIRIFLLTRWRVKLLVF